MRKTILCLVLITLLTGSCDRVSSKDYNAWNYPQSLQTNGLVIQIGRIYMANRDALKDDFLKAPYYQNKPVVVEVIFVVQNQSSGTMSVYPTQGVVTVNGEQVDLYEASLNGRLGESVDGEILPGITKIGGVWFGLRRSTLEDIKSMNIIIAAPYDVNNNLGGGEFQFKLDLSDRKHDKMPTELK